MQFNQLFVLSLNQAQNKKEPEFIENQTTLIFEIDYGIYFTMKHYNIIALVLQFENVVCLFCAYKIIRDYEFWLFFILFNKTKFFLFLIYCDFGRTKMLFTILVGQKCCLQF